MIMEDSDALIAFADADSAATNGPMGCVGYCMSGQYAINAAARHPDRVAAAASIYGVRLVTDDADSPHRMAAKAKGELYFACAEHDSWAPLEMVETLQAALKDDGVGAEVEIYPGVEHGFAFPQRAAYDKDAAERHWERLIALYRRRLGWGSFGGGLDEVIPDRQSETNPPLVDQPQAQARDDEGEADRDLDEGDRVEGAQHRAAIAKIEHHAREQRAADRPGEEERSETLQARHDQPSGEDAADLPAFSAKCPGKFTIC
jgi:hypothetical protein